MPLGTSRYDAMKSTPTLALLAVVAGALGGATLGYWEARPWELDDLAGAAPAAATPSARNAGDSAPNRGPVALAKETTYEFGNMESGTKKRHSFPIKNDGDAPLKITFLSHTCKCTEVKLGDKPVEPNDAIEVSPGGETTVALEWAAKVPPGPFRHGADFSTNDPRLPRLEIKVEGEIVASSTLLPAQFAFGTVRAGDKGRAEVLVLSFLEPEVKLEAPTVVEPKLAEHLTVTTEPVAKADLPDKNAVAGARLVAVYDARAGAGPFGGSIRVGTNLDKAQVLEIPVYGSVKGDVSIFGRGWNEAAGLLRMAPVASAEGGKTRLSVTVRGQQAAVIMLAVAKVEPAELKAALGERRTVGAIIQQELTIEIPPGTRPMVRAGENDGGEGQIVLSTTNPLTPEVRLRVNFTVKP